MKKQLVLRQYLLVIACIFLSYVTYSQESDHFKMVDIPTRVLKIDQVFTSDDQLPLDQMKAPISGLAISGEISFNSDSSLVRVILIDKQNDEYLVFETYPFLAEAVSFTITGWCEETARLSNVTAQALRLEIIDASFQLNEILISERPSATGFRTMDKSEDQRAAKIAKLNESIKERGNYWRAGETSVSRLSYQEKKQLFGNKIPNLQGFDYYVGGVFVIPGALEAPVEESPFVEEFSWRKRHGQDWSTAVKNQGFCGSCWAFGAVGATELMVNLYYNRHINIDLSEQEVLSCSNAGSCSGGFSGGALNYIREHGISNEQCYPYAALDLPCANKCNTPTEKIQIENYQYHPSSDMQRFIFQKPAAFGISSWGHCITLMGFKVLEEGDRVAEDFSIPSGDPIIGRLAWEIKNSWGSGWGEGGFGYVLTVPDNIGSSYSISGKVTSMNYNDNDIVCEDKDGDGYYNWGIGEKPAHCLTCPDEPDGDDASPYLGPMDEYGIMKVNIPFVTVNAKGTEAGGVFAHYKVYLNDELVGDTYASANYKADTFAIPSSIGEIEKLTVVFDNDALILGEDRNLSVKNVSINQNKIAASNKNVVYKRKTGEIIPFDELMPWEGELIFDLKEIYSKIIVSAKGSQADGEFAHFKVYVDGTEIANEYTSSTYKSYQFTLLVNSNNIDEIKISFDNDALDNGNDRNLYVQSIGLNGEIIEATAENVTYKRTTGEVIPYNGVMPWNGDLIFEFAPAICKGDITLSSQAEVDAFNCEAVTGTLTISGSDITNVDSLSELKSVENLIIKDNPALLNLNGLASLERVSFTLDIVNNSSLESAQGLDSIENLYHLTISNNASLINLNGFKAIHYMWELTIMNNDLLVNVDALSSLIGIVDYLIIDSNKSLKNLDGLKGVPYLPYTITITNNESIENLDFLQAIYYASDLTIANNSSLKNVDFLSDLFSMNNLYIENNSILENVDGLSSLHYIGGVFSLKDNAMLSKCCGLYTLLSSDISIGSINISGNGADCTEADILAGGSCEGDLIVTAQGSHADGEFAHFKVDVDGTEIGNAYTSSTYESYKFTLPVNSTNVDEIKISFDNDALVNGDDRNLYVQSIGLNGEVIEATAENVTYKRKTGEVIPYNGVMPWNGDLIFSDFDWSASARIGELQSKSINNRSEGLGFTIYPNPGSGIFTLAFNNLLDENLKLDVTDQLGRTVFTREIYNNQKQTFDVDLFTLPSGIYFLRLSSDKNVSVKRVIN